jgi:hypothetical protein
MHHSIKLYLNMFAYCQIKAGHHRQSVNSILQYLRIFPSRSNAASGYLKIVLQILNYLSIYNCQSLMYRIFKLTEIVEFTSAIYFRLQQFKDRNYLDFQSVNFQRT